jgi:hypothetical protein
LGLTWNQSRDQKKQVFVVRQMTLTFLGNESVWMPNAGEVWLVSKDGGVNKLARHSPPDGR